jgi:hypothetical protein
MPIARYLVVVGGTLVALVLAVNWYVADAPGSSSTLPVQYAPLMPQAADFDFRLQSGHGWPERLLLGTELPE